VLVWRADSLEYSEMDGAFTAPGSASLSGAVEKGVMALCFCDRGSKLACVGADRANTLYIFAWGLGTLVTKAPGEPEGGRAILAVNADTKDGQIVTVGVNHVRFWNLTGRKISSLPGVFGRQKGAWQSFQCVEFADAGKKRVAVTGTQDGSVYVWRANHLVHVVQASAPLPARLPRRRARAAPAGRLLGTACSSLTLFIHLFIYFFRRAACNCLNASCHTL